MVGPIVVTTTAGPVRGFVDTHRLSEHSTALSSTTGDRPPVRKWLGIPYAKAGRWEKPCNPDPWIEVQDCLEFGPAFPQLFNPFDRLYTGRQGWLTRESLGQSEDAFSVNVFSPAADLRGLPVLVWMYGGNLNSGSGNFPIYEPSEFVRQQEQNGTPCIVVTGNYRVGVFGFLSTDDLTAVQGRSGNYGLFDCMRIFEWTRENIRAFGGDPDNVTAFGESAGAYLLAALLYSGRRLFNKVILESGNHALLRHRSRPLFPRLNDMLNSLGIQTEGGDAQSRVKQLKLVPTNDLLQAAGKVAFPGTWGLTRDEDEACLSTTMWNRLEKGEYDPWIESIVIGINEDEGTFFNNRAQWWKEENLVLQLKRQQYNIDEMYEDFRKLYGDALPASPDSDIRDLGSTKFYYDASYLTPMIHLVDSLTKIPNSVTKKTIPVYAYHFETLPQRLLQGHERLGVLHTGEIPFVLNAASLWDYEEDHPDSRTARLVGQFWSVFARSGSPGAGWPAYSTEGGEMIVFKESGETSLRNLQLIRTEYQRFWYPLQVTRNTTF